jgi:hypothetical protein
MVLFALLSGILYHDVMEVSFRARIVAQLHAYRQHFFMGFFLLGVLGDVLFLPELSPGAPLFYLTSLFGLLTATYVLLTIEEWRIPEQVKTLLAQMYPVFLGSIFSAVFVYYSRAAHLSVDVPFLACLGLMALGAELSRKRLELFIFRSALWYVALLMVITLLLPVWQNSLSLRGTILALFFALPLGLGVYLSLAKAGVPWQMVKNVGVLACTVTLALLLLLGLRVLPPLPLALKHAEVVYHVTPVSSGIYHLMRPLVTEYGGWRMPSFSQERGTLSLYTAVYAPTQLSTTIIHEWQYIDPKRGVWVTKSRVGFPISGGRAMGYRGYTTVSVTPGYWRVRIMTEEGAVLGIETFQVTDAPLPELGIQLGK